MGAAVAIAAVGAGAAVAGTGFSIFSAFQGAKSQRAAAEGSYRMQQYANRVESMNQTLARGIQQGEAYAAYEKRVGAAWTAYNRQKVASRQNYQAQVDQMGEAYRKTQAMVVNKRMQMGYGAGSASAETQAIAEMGKAGRQMFAMNENFANQMTTLEEQYDAAAEPVAWKLQIPGAYQPGGPAATPNAGMAGLGAAIQGVGNIANSAGRLVNAVNNYNTVQYANYLNQGAAPGTVMPGQTLSADGTMSYNPNSGMGQLATYRNLGIGFNGGSQ